MASQAFKTPHNLDNSQRIRACIFLGFLSLCAGLLVGLAAVGFRLLLQFSHNLFLYHIYSWHEVSSARAAYSSIGIWIIPTIVVGGVVVIALVEIFAPSAKGHGVPEIMSAIFYKKGRMGTFVGGVKALVSAISIGTGAPVGREGPIAQIGASVTALLSRLSRVDADARIVLLSGGAAAALAAIFNAPIAGVIFALEIFLPDVNGFTLFYAMIMSASAVFVDRLVFGSQPVFAIPPQFTSTLSSLHASDYISFVVMGIAAGFLSALFVHTLDFCEHKISGFFKNPYIRSIVLLSIVGVILATLHIVYGHYLITDGGYTFTKSALDGTLSHSVWLLIVIIVAQIIGASLALTGGASGSVFSPSLAVGAAFGLLFGIMMHSLFPASGLDIVEYGALGVAGVLGGVIAVVFSASVFVFEMTGDYTLILPLLIVAPLAFVTRSAIISASAYTLSFRRTGREVVLPLGRTTSFYLTNTAYDVMSTHFVVWSEQASLLQFRDYITQHGAFVAHTVLVLQDDRQRIIGAIDADVLSHKISEDDTIALKEYMDPAITVFEQSSIRSVFHVVYKSRSTYAVVMHEDKENKSSSVCGIIGPNQMARVLMSIQDSPTHDNA